MAMLPERNETTVAGDEPAAVGPPPSDAPRVEWALWYARAHEWPVFPVYEMRENGAGHLVCSCGDAACDSPGKHPRSPDGWKNATTETAEIRECFERWPRANIGTPFPSVLDCDLPRESDPNDGVAEWRKLEKKHGVVTGAAVARSGGGGVHVFFAPGSPGGKVGRGLSLRGAGLYAVLPPSVHKSGTAYLWERPPVVGRALPKLPTWLANRQKTATRKLKDKITSDETIPVNERHDAIASYIGSLRRRNPSLSEEEARTLAHAFRLERCESPQEKVSDVDDLVSYVYAKDPALGDEPWSGPIPGGAELFDRVCDYISRYMVMGEHELVVTTLYSALTWVFDAVDTCGYLRVVSPVRRCGKSRLLTILSSLVRNPLPSGGMSEAALFRSLDEKPRTILADEIGKVLAAAGKDRNSDVLRVYLNGFERGWPVQRVVGEGTNQTVVDFDVYGPKVLGGTGQLDDQILDRSWVVNLVRKKSADKVARYRRREAAREATELRRQLEAWAASVAEASPMRAPISPTSWTTAAKISPSRYSRSLILPVTSGLPRRARPSLLFGVGRSRTTRWECNCRRHPHGLARGRGDHHDAATAGQALRGRHEPLATRMGREPPRDGRRGRHQTEPRRRHEAGEGVEAVRGQAAEHRPRAGEGVHAGRLRGRVFSLPPLDAPRGRSGRSFRRTKPK